MNIPEVPAKDLVFEYIFAIALSPSLPAPVLGLE